MNKKKLLTLEEIKEIVLSSSKEVIQGKNDLSYETILTGPRSSIESIEIVQIVSAIEEKLEEEGIEGYDLFDEIFKIETHSLDSLAQLIKNGINE